MLFGVAVRILKRSEWAEEVLQESFVSVWRHAARYDRARGAPMTWLIRIVPRVHRHIPVLEPPNLGDASLEVDAAQI